MSLDAGGLHELSGGVDHLLAGEWQGIRGVCVGAAVRVVGVL